MPDDDGRECDDGYARDPRAAERFPVDYDALAKGDYLGPDQVEALVGELRETAAYSLKAVALAQQIKRELWARGKRWTVCIRAQGIAVLTDPEASAYNAARFDQHTRGLGRTHLTMAAVDAAALAAADRQAHDRALVLQGATLAAVAAARRAVRPIPVRPARDQLPGA